MAGTVTTTEVTHTSVKKLTFTWTSDASGDADGSSTAAFDGKVIAVLQVPDGGVTTPSNLYDVTVTDADGHDVLAGLGENIANTGPTYVAGSDDDLLAVADSVLTVTVANGGNAKGGKVIVYIR